MNPLLTIILQPPDPPLAERAVRNAHRNKVRSRCGIALRGRNPTGQRRHRAERPVVLDVGMEQMTRELVAKNRAKPLDFRELYKDL